MNSWGMKMAMKKMISIVGISTALLLLLTSVGLFSENIYGHDVINPIEDDHSFCVLDSGLAARSDSSLKQ